MHTLHKNSRQAPVPEVVVFGCGNVLLGDDGFGPAVIEALYGHSLPPTVQAIDAGTSIREYLLDYLMLPALRPRLLIVVDACDAVAGAVPAGRVTQGRPATLPAQKSHDFSLHQFPTVNLLLELEEETGIEVVLLIAATAVVPERIAPGLSPLMRTAVAEARDRILGLVRAHCAGETSKAATP